MTFGSLFSGAGGMDLGLERAGMECRWQVEIDPFCRKVPQKHWPGVKRYGDIRTVSAIEPVDLIAGGFPCQPFSHASSGKRKGADDDRYLWPEMLRIIEVAQPSWVIGENVAGLDGTALEQVVSSLEALGYEVAPPLEIPACAFGLDHWRKRLWILGYSDRHRQSGMSVHAKAPRLSRSGGVAGRVGEAHGVPRGVDRSKRLNAVGNAVVPAIPEWIGRLILQAAAFAIEKPEPGKADNYPGPRITSSIGVLKLCLRSL